MTTTQQLPLPPVAATTGRSAARRFWPDARGAAPWQVFVVAAIAAVATGFTEPYAVVGSAGLLTGLAVCAGPVTVAATDRATRRRLLRPLTLVAGAGVVALLAVGVFRSAGWLYALCVLAAFGLGSYALAGGTRWPGVLSSTVVTWVAAARGIPWVARGFARPTGGDGDDGTVAKSRRRPLRALAVSWVTAVLLVIFGILFASADAAFARLLSDLVPDVDAWSLSMRTFMAACTVVLTLGAAFAARMPPRTDRLAGSGEERVGRWEWAVPAGALVLLFAAFVGVQFAVLFGGDEHVRLTSGLTYAEYVHKGFGQLVVVTLLTLAVLATIGRLAPRESSRDRLLVRVIAGTLCVLTLVIVASALYRMHLYQEAYGFTRLRLLVSLFEAWLGVLFLLVLAAGARLRGGWLPRAVVGTAAAAMLGLAVANPDALIADRNITRYQQTNQLDIQYLRSLSADAAPVLDRLTEERRSCALQPLANELTEDRPWYARTIADHRAAQLLADRPIDRAAACP